jgi:hypothetical protein
VLDVVVRGREGVGFGVNFVVWIGRVTEHYVLLIALLMEAVKSSGV